MIPAAVNPACAWSGKVHPVLLLPVVECACRESGVYPLSYKDWPAAALALFKGRLENFWEARRRAFGF